MCHICLAQTEGKSQLHCKKILSITGQTSLGADMKSCLEQNYAMCSLVKTTRTFYRKHTNHAFPITCRLICESKEVIYVIKCRAYGLQYVGETARPLKARILSCLLEIRSGHPSTLLHSHFAKDCSPIIFHFLVYAFTPNNTLVLPKRPNGFKTSTLSPRLITWTQHQPPKTTSTIKFIPYYACATQQPLKIVPT